MWVNQDTQTPSVKFISFVGDFYFDAIRPLFTELDAIQEDHSIERIELTLTSAGGYFHSAFAVFDYLKAFPKPVDIIATGCCQSSALLVLQSGRKRLSRPHTNFMLHAPWHHIPDKKSLAAIRNDAAEFERQENVFFELLAYRSSVSQEKLRQLCNHEHFFNSQKALKYGLIDEIAAVDEFDPKNRL